MAGRLVWDQIYGSPILLTPTNFAGDFFRSHVSVFQWLEGPPDKRVVGSSIPPTHTILIKNKANPHYNLCRGGFFCL